MTIEIIRNALGWCGVINFGMLLLWFLVFSFAPALIYRTHGKWYKLSEEKISEIHYNGMLFFKLGIFLFNIVPYLALRIVG
ncbi:MAG: DUF6868 family protein [Thermodesulfobacteriota bacterium]